MSSARLLQQEVSFASVAQGVYETLAAVLALDRTP